MRDGFETRRFSMVVGFFTIFLLGGVYVLWRAWCLQRAWSTELSELRRLLKEAEQLLKRRGALADELAHEIKNPLGAIVCSAEALDLLSGATLPAEQRRCLGMIRDFSDHVMRLVTDFLDLNRIDGGRVKAEIQDVDVRAVIMGIRDLLNPAASRRDVKLLVEVPEEALGARVDPRHLKQVLFNLLHNALKFTPSGGEVVMKAIAEGSGVSLQIKDTGPGIEPAILARLFEPYVTGRSGDALTDRGYGIGLAVCRALIEMNKGKISVQTAIGQGSTFKIDLPLGRLAQTETASRVLRRRSERAQVISGKRVLVCEEDPVCGEATSALLNAWGAMVDKVTSAADAVRALGNAHYDAVVTSSAALQGEGGAIVSTAHAAGTPILATGHATPDQLRALDVDAAITGPLSGDSLLRGLESCTLRPR